MNCRQLTSGEKAQAIREFESVLLGQGLHFEKVVSPVSVNEIGVPPIKILFNHLKKPQHRWLVITRTAELLLFTILLVIVLATNPFGMMFESVPGQWLFNLLVNPIDLLLLFYKYVLISLGLVTGTILLLYMDSVLIWIGSSQKRSNKAYFIVTSTSLILFVAVVGVSIESLLAWGITMAPLQGWAALLIGSSAMIFLVAGFTIGGFRVYLSISHPAFVFFEERYVTVRECLRSRNSIHTTNTMVPPHMSAINQLLRMNVLRHVVLLAIALLSAIFMQNMISLTLSFIHAVFLFVALGIIVFLGVAMAYFLRSKRMLSDLALTTNSIVVFVMAVPFVFCQLGLLLIVVIYIGGMLSTVYLWRTIRAEINKQPEILGCAYYRTYLAQLDHDSAVHFVQDVLSEIRDILP